MLYVIRHGETVHNAAGIIQGPRIDSDLSETGHQQAASLGQRFQDLPLDTVYASPLQRARDTAAALDNKAPILMAPELVEMDFGHFCGQLRQPLMPEIMRIVDAWKAGFHDVAFPGGESAALANFRVHETVKRIEKEAKEGDVAVVAHGRINRILIAAVAGTGLSSLEQYPQDNASITAIEDGQVIIVNDTRHVAEFGQNRL